MIAFEGPRSTLIRLDFANHQRAAPVILEDVIAFAQEGANLRVLFGRSLPSGDLSVTRATLSEGLETVTEIHLDGLRGDTRPRGFLSAVQGHGMYSVVETPGTDRWTLTGMNVTAPATFRIPAAHSPFGVAIHKGLVGVLCLKPTRDGIELWHARGTSPVVTVDAPIEAVTASADSHHLAYRDVEGRLALFDLRTRQHLFTLRTEVPP
jgi:hypothetical protein